MTVTAAPAARVRLRVDTRTTPGKLRVLLVTLVTGSLAWGAVAAVTASQHAAAAADVVGTSEPLSLDAEQIYQSLSDADATAANAFLSGGLEPAAARQRYSQDIKAAGTTIEGASARVGAAAISTTRGDLAVLSADLPVYAGEVETARADNRLGLPVGAAYLREASGLLRTQMLTAASDIYKNENALLTKASAQATGLPLLIVALVLGLAVCYLLLRASRWLSRRTHRVINAGLAVALLAAVVSVLWLAGALLVGRADLLSAQRNGSVPAEAYARAEVASLLAHADESLTLINNTGDDANQADFLARRAPLDAFIAAGRSAANGADPHGAAAAADVQAWYRAHQALRALDNTGNHAAAVASAQNGAAAAAFGRLSRDLSLAVSDRQAVFARSARAGRDAFTGLTAGMLAAAVIMAAASAFGLNHRLAEYR